MGLSLKGLIKGAVRIGGKLAKPILAQTPIGMAALKAQQALKAAGVSLRTARLKPIQPLSVQASVSRVATPLAKRTLQGPPRRKRDAGKGKASPTKRRAPTGGLDLKAIAVRWRAAGKPGRWIDFVKASR